MAYCRGAANAQYSSRRRRQGRSEDYPRPVLFHSVAGGSVACFLYAPTCTAAVRELTGTGAEAQTDSALGRQTRRVSAGSVELTCAAIRVGMRTLSCFRVRLRLLP
jgi:hypothetical protein